MVPRQKVFESMNNAEVQLFFVICFSLIFLVIGIGFIIISITSKRKAHSSIQWPIAIGTVISAMIKDRADIDDGDYSTSHTYEPVIKYTYQVMGKEYQSTRIAFGANSFDQARALLKINSYPIGKPLQVRYNPNNPSESVVETSAAGGNLFLIGGILFLTVGLIACCAGTAITLISQ
jgi:hypothetical protein